jgi:arylsulfatase A-like enzyme
MIHGSQTLLKHSFIADKSSFLKYAIMEKVLTSMGMIACSFSACNYTEPKSDKPNILIIFADDLGYADIGCYGSEDIPTPNIDELAENGVRFTSGYVMMPYCAPSRAALLTGRHPVSFGFYRNPTPVLATNQGLPAGCSTVPKYLKKQGYTTGAIGKWHLGTRADNHPNSVGFDEWYGFLGGAHMYFPLGSYGDMWDKMERPWNEAYVNMTLPIIRNSQPAVQNGYLTTDLTEKGLDFIRRNKEKPFYLFMSYNAPHSPLEAPEEEIARFPAEKVSKLPDVPAKSRGIYAAMVSILDKGVGDIIKTLREEGLEKNTIVWFISDNGGWSGVSDNRPLHGAKGDIYEGGIRVPFILSWPGNVKGGQVLEQAVTTLDVGATVCALSGGPQNIELHGKSLMPLVTGKTMEAIHETLYWKHGYNRKGHYGAIRQGDYKLVILEPRTPCFELYNLKIDISEQNDLSQSDSKRADKMFAAWVEWDDSNPETLWITPKQEDWYKYQYANYEWLKGSNHYTTDPDKISP